MTPEQLEQRTVDWLISLGYTIHEWEGYKIALSDKEYVGESPVHPNDFAHVFGGGIFINKVGGCKNMTPSEYEYYSNLYPRGVPYE